MKLSQLFSVIIDTILPPHERTARTNQRTFQAFTPSPTIHEHLGTHVTTLFSYTDAAAHDAIGALKFEKSARAARLLAAALAEYLREEMADIRTFSSHRIILVAVPLHPKRERERGFNQIERVLAELPPDLNTHHVAGVIVRNRDTPHQTTLSRAERLQNVAHAFSLAPDVDVSGAHIILIDDVTTTGATLVHASLPLRAAGSEVTLLALAHA